MPCRLIGLGLLLLAAALGPATPMLGPATPALAHDPSAWGGLYRTRDGGATWFLANEGRFVTAALDLAVDPSDPARLLLATDSGLLRSVNGGRDWDVDPSPLLRGAVFAVALDREGARAMASTGTAIVVADEADGGSWRAVSAPSGSAPARQIVSGPRPGQVYLAGWRGLARSDDWGRSWQPLGDDLPGQAVSRLLVVPDGPTGRPRLLASIGGTLWTSQDDGDSWRRVESAPAHGLDTVVADGTVPGRLWGGGADRVYRSDDGGARWQPVGGPLEDRDTPISGIGATPDGRVLLLTTDRGLYRSADGGARWELLAEGVPVHLPARPLVRLPGEEASFYVGFSIRPYDALWQSAADGTNAFERLDAVNLGGALAFLALLALGGGFSIQRLRRYYRPPLSEPMPEVSP